MTAGPLLICIRCILYSIVHLPTSVTFLPHPVLQKFFVRNPWCLKLSAGRDKIKFSVLGEVASTWKKQKKRRVGIFKKSSAEKKLMRETLSRLSAFYKFDYGFCIYLKLSCSSFSRERSARKKRCILIGFHERHFGSVRLCSFSWGFVSDMASNIWWCWKFPLAATFFSGGRRQLTVTHLSFPYLV